MMTAHTLRILLMFMSTLACSPLEAAEGVDVAVLPGGYGIRWPEDSKRNYEIRLRDQEQRRGTVDKLR